MFQFKHKTILILSPEDWGKNQLSKHIYAKELSKNNTVYFLHTVEHPNQLKSIRIDSISDSLKILHLKKLVKGITKLPSSLIDIQNKLIIKKIKKVINQPIDVIWSFDQSKFQNLNQFNAKTKIFHPVDHIKKALPFVKKIADSADIVLSVSEKILDTIDSNTPKYFINHGLDEIFLKSESTNQKYSFINPNKTNVGYVGNLNMNLIDWENLKKTVIENNTLNFVFIGPDKDSNLGGFSNKMETVKSLPNTYFTGSLSKLELSQLLPYFDMFWLCYNGESNPIATSNSHKILEYLSTGKVVIANYTSTYKDSNLIEMVGNNSLISNRIADIANKIDEFNTLKKTSERINFAKKNSYSYHIEKIENLIGQL